MGGNELKIEFLSFSSTFSKIAIASSDSKFFNIRTIASEERNLKLPSYRKKISEGIYKAIIKFKSSREKILAEE